LKIHLPNPLSNLIPGKPYDMRNFLYFGLLLLLTFQIKPAYGQETINLAGVWRFAADSSDKGIQEHWFNKKLSDTILLPGSMTTNNKGNDITINTPWTGQIVDSSWFRKPEYAPYRKFGNTKVPFWLQPVKYYKGVAWYQKSVVIPDTWKHKTVELFLERCHWKSQLWVDNYKIGMQNSLGTPHIYNLSKYLSPGKHVLSIRIDNSVKEINVGQNSHSISDHTQGNWNGMIGKLELQARPDTYLSDVQLYPDIHGKTVHVKVTIANHSGKTMQTKLLIKAKGLQKDSHQQPVIIKDYSISTSDTLLEFDYPMNQPLLWDEFHPNLYQMAISFVSSKNNIDNKAIIFGMREFKTKGSQFTINGRLTFLRGTLECAVFPRTGYPPTDTASWGRIFRIAKSYGLNHFRFHSWCPPEAAFEAADHAGFYLQIECSSWANQGATIGDELPLDQWIYDESNRMVNAYGNHPSFCIMLYGNEPAGKNMAQWLTDFAHYWKNKDSRRLYSSGAGWPFIKDADFYSTPVPRIQAWGEGLNSIINAQPPRSDYDWSQKIADITMPVVSHEIGQWCVYPDFKEIKQYTGVLKAKNFEIFHESLKMHHMSQLADSFLLASGKLQTLCYKTDIEAALRTPGFGGFQTLGLQDFPGQGTALVGALNAFWKGKGYVTSKDYRHFCNAVVPLVRLPRMIFQSSDTLIAPVAIANFGEKEMEDMVPKWEIADKYGKIIFSGTLPKKTIEIGNGIKLGVIQQPLVSITKASELTLSVSVGNYINTWKIWVYPATLPTIHSSVYVTQELDEKSIDILNKGGDVLLTIKKGSIKPDKGGDIAIGFSSIFWNTAWTHGQAPTTLGILCNPKNPALADFPTEYYSNWEWWDAMTHSNAIILSDFSQKLRPIVRVIDDWVTNRPLGLLLEARAGKGRIIVSGVDLLTNAEKRPEAQQLLYSLKKYMTGKSFHPKTMIDIEKLKALFN